MDELDRRAAERTTGRRALEVVFWVVALGTLWFLDSLSKLAERARTGVGPGDARLVVEQVTSGLGALALVPFAVAWVNRFPLGHTRVLPTVLGHLAGTVLFALGHYGLIVLFRTVVYGWSGRVYVFWGDLSGNLVYEYLKDIKIYVGMVAVITAYRYYLRDSVKVGRSADGNPRLVVQTGTGETLLPLDAIEYLEAARNYVAVHSGGREYLVRDTLANLESRLAGNGFARAHRSYVVNLAQIAEIRSTARGGNTIRLHGGGEVPLGRSYRDIFRARMVSPGDPG